MKKTLLKIITTALALTMLFSLTACTYRQEGSVCQDVDFTVNYENTESEKVSIDVTATFYKTFAPKTSEHLLKLIKNGYYNDSALVFDKTGEYLVLGSFDYKDNAYVEKIYTGEPVKGEFEKAGFASKLEAKAGSLVLLREPDSKKATSSRYNTGKASIAILLNDVSSLSNDVYCVFGKVNEDAVDAFLDMKGDLMEDEAGDIKVRYIGDRDDNDNLIVENNKYKNGKEFYINNGEYKELDKTVIEEKIDGDIENELYKKLKEAYPTDLYALPIKPIKVSGFDIK